MTELTETIFVARVFGRLQRMGWTLREIGEVWNINRFRVSELIGTARLYNPPSMASICKEVSAKHDVPLDQMMSRRRLKALVAARTEAISRIRAETRASLPQIGRHFGHKDHTSVIHALRKPFTSRAQESV